jgi:predicted metal-dependent phosphoesterase TrpH
MNTDTLAMKYAPIRDVILRVGEAGGVVIPSHPFRGVNSAGELLLDLSGLAGLEGYNGANMHAMNVKAIELAQRLGLPFTGGSDAHAPSEVGSCYTEFDASVTIDNFLERLKEGRFYGVDNRKISRAVWP